MAERDFLQDILGQAEQLQPFLNTGGVERAELFADEQRSRGEQVRELVRQGNQPIPRNLFDKLSPLVTLAGAIHDATGRNRGVRRGAGAKASQILGGLEQRREGQRQTQRQRANDAIAALELGGRFSAQGFGAIQEAGKTKAAGKRAALTAAGGIATREQKAKLAKGPTFNAEQEKQRIIKELGDIRQEDLTSGQKLMLEFATGREFEDVSVTENRVFDEAEKVAAARFDKRIAAAEKDQNVELVQQLEGQRQIFKQNWIEQRSGGEKEELMGFIENLLQQLNQRTARDFPSLPSHLLSDPSDFAPAVEGGAPPTLEQLFQGAESSRRGRREQFRGLREADLRDIITPLIQPSESTRR